MVTSSYSGRRTLSALARHSVQDERDIERCQRRCALGCRHRCEHEMPAYDAVAAARAQREVDISTLSTRTLRRRAQRFKARERNALDPNATEVGWCVYWHVRSRADVCVHAMHRSRMPLVSLVVCVIDIERAISVSNRSIAPPSIEWRCDR